MKAPLFIKLKHKNNYLRNIYGKSTTEIICETISISKEEFQIYIFVYILCSK